MKLSQTLHFLLIFSAIFLISCSNNGPESPPNIVWITSEDNSVHYMKMFSDLGVETPNIEKLAEHGLKFEHAFSNAPVCSVARSTIISGCYCPRIGAQYHRKIKSVPMPEGLEMFPAYLKKAGYYTTNNSKEDYNIIKGENVWDESSGNAHWKNRAEGQPFFHVFNIGTTHESSLHFTRDEMNANPTQTPLNRDYILPVHPDTKLFEYTNAYYRDKVREMDRQVGEVVQEIMDAGLMENTFIFYYGDHGGVLPGSKGYLYETGLHVPMVVRIPENYRHLVDFEPGSAVEGFVSFVDLAPTVLNLAGIEIPDAMDGKPFMGLDIDSTELNSRNETFGYADRFDEKYDMVRSLRVGDWKYIRNYQPFNFDGLWNNYRYKQLAYLEWFDLFRQNKLNDVQSQFFRKKPAEMLFELSSDPYETRNLSDDPAYLAKLEKMRSWLNKQVSDMPDLSFFPEHYLMEHAFENPVEFGISHREQIKKYIEIANYQISDLAEVRDQLLKCLGSDDPWERYWALIDCSAFAENDPKLVEKAIELSNRDPEPLVRTRAAEYLGIIDVSDPSNSMVKALYDSDQPAEGLLILNSIVLMQDGSRQYSFRIEPGRIQDKVRNNSEVMRRLDYLLKDTF